MTSLVTGGAGFIGSHLVDHLIENGHKVVVLDNLSSGKKSNINPKAIFCKYDINDQIVRGIFATHKFDYVFHLAANAKIPECTEKPMETFETNVLGTLHLLQLSKEYQVKAFIYSSSSSIYGRVSLKRKIREVVPANPISMYGLEKYQAEQLVRIYAPIYGVPTISLRYFNVYGTSRQSADGPYANVFSAFIRDYKKYGKVSIFGDGWQERDFVHVYDVVQANLLAAQFAKKYSGEVINLGSGNAVSINTIASRLGFPVEYKEARKEDPLYSCAQTQHVEKLLGIKKFIPLEEGIDILLKSYEK